MLECQYASCKTITATIISHLKMASKVNKHFPKGSGYRTAYGSLNLKPHSTTSCNVTVTHEENKIQ